MTIKTCVLNLYGHDLDPLRAADARKLVKMEREQAKKFELKFLGYLVESEYKNVRRPVFAISVSNYTHFRVLTTSMLAVIVDHNKVRTASGKKLRGAVFQEKPQPKPKKEPKESKAFLRGIEQGWQTVIAQSKVKAPKPAAEVISDFADVVES